MSDSSMIIRLMTVVTIVAVFAIFVADWSPGVEVQGFTELQDATDDDPSGGFPEVVDVQPPTSGDCAPWDIPCLTGDIFGPIFYIGTLIFAVVWWVFQVIAWAALFVFNLFASIFSVATITITGLPSEFQTLLTILSVPALVLVIFAIARFIRGNEG